ncbi:MAG: hypothetical protein IKM24_01845 [Clostridia bacterium]|nr:hypothetical protein [Clostridia bacterium]
MFYFIVLLAIFIITPYAFFSKKLIAGVTKGENYESVSPIGKKRSWIYCIGVVISLAINIFDFGKTWLYSSYTISGLFVPYTYAYQVLYGDDAARDVFIVLALELLFFSAVLFCRGLSAGMVYRFIKDGDCTKYKYIKRLMWVLVFALIFQTAFFFTTAFEASTIERITDTHYDIDSDTSFVTYNTIWILAFSGIIHTLSRNKMAFGTYTSENKSDVKSNVEARQKSSTSFTDESNSGIQTQPTSNINEYSADETRLAEIEAELKKIPVAKVKQWHADGKLSEEQYKSIAQKYNALKKERADILERMELLRNI